MSILDIPPHSKRISRLALGLLALVAVASFVVAILRPPDLAAPAPPPPTDAAGSGIAEARAITMPAFEPAPVRRVRFAPVVDAVAPADAQTAAADTPATPAEPPPALDAAATAPAPPPAPAPAKSAPAPEDPPN